MSETSGKVWPCKEINKDSAGNWVFNDSREDFWCFVTNWFSCPVCHAKRPEEEKDEPDHDLDRLIDSLDWTGFTRPKLEQFKKDLRAWKEKDASLLHQLQNTFPKVGTASGSGLNVGKEEKPKRLQDVISNSAKIWGMPLSSGNARTIKEGVIEWVEGILNEIQIDKAPNSGAGRCLAEIRQRLEREKNNG